MGNKLFTNTIAASPYLPMQYGYKDWVPSQSYYSFAARAGCDPFTAYGSSNTTVLECLRRKDSTTLIAASQNISASGTYGTWGFLPVTDGKAVQQLPSIQLQSKALNGQRLLVGNNANEGREFTPQTITTEDDLVAWLELTFPLFTKADISKILLTYPTTNNSVDSSAPLFATTGDSGPTALNQSSVGTGQQQRANNIYAETTFVCPSYWMAEAYSGQNGFSSYKYQYSVPLALHGQDVSGYFGPATAVQGPDFEYAFMNIWGNFITIDNPSISNKIANGAASNSTASNAASSWPTFNVNAPYQLNLNQSGGALLSIPMTAAANATELVGSTLRNDFRLVNAYTWEGGRGARCNFWRNMGVAVPE
ncbi:carboxylesterase 2 [Venturia nashicola]|uniref:Carboxylesterase 2 n=1 Tax=Venturia nashicola TaxID=86259 RepID=A0A4Z1NC41_9PEZI|nr:carboxylesterase 2 [Venturia nashicola]